MKVERNSKWEFVGGSEGFGLKHTIIGVSGIHITTWSDLGQGKDNEPGYSWSGKRSDFLELFKFVSAPPKPAT